MRLVAETGPATILKVGLDKPEALVEFLRYMDGAAHGEWTMREPEAALSAVDHGPATGIIEGAQRMLAEEEPLLQKACNRIVDGAVIGILIPQKLPWVEFGQGSIAFVRRGAEDAVKILARIERGLAVLPGPLIYWKESDKPRVCGPLDREVLPRWRALFARVAARMERFETSRQWREKLIVVAKSGETDPRNYVAEIAPLIGLDAGSASEPPEADA